MMYIMYKKLTVNLDSGKQNDIDTWTDMTFTNTLFLGYPEVHSRCFSFGHKHFPTCFVCYQILRQNQLIMFSILPKFYKYSSNTFGLEFLTASKLCAPFNLSFLRITATSTLQY